MHQSGVLGKNREAESNQTFVKWANHNCETLLLKRERDSHVASRTFSPFDSACFSKGRGAWTSFYMVPKFTGVKLSERGSKEIGPLREIHLVWKMSFCCPIVNIASMRRSFSAVGPKSLSHGCHWLQPAGHSTQSTFSSTVAISNESKRISNRISKKENNFQNFKWHKISKKRASECTL